MMLLQGERSGCVQVAIETDQVAESSECIIENDVHAAGMNLLDRVSPPIDGAEMWLENREVEWRVLVVAPGGVDKGRTGEIQTLGVASARRSEHNKRGKRHTLIPMPSM